MEMMTLAPMMMTMMMMVQVHCHLLHPAWQALQAATQRLVALHRRRPAVTQSTVASRPPPHCGRCARSVVTAPSVQTTARHPGLQGCCSSHHHYHHHRCCCCCCHARRPHPPHRRHHRYRQCPDHWTAATRAVMRVVLQHRGPPCAARSQTATPSPPRRSRNSQPAP